MKRKATLPRHSKSLLPSLRIPRPLWAWGRPKLSVKSHSANKHSTRSLLGSLRSRRSTVGSIDRSLLKHPPQLLGGDGYQLSRAFKPAIPRFGRFLERRDLLRGDAVFTLRVIGRFDFNLAQGNHVAATDNPDVLPSRGSIEPPA